MDLRQSNNPGDGDPESRRRREELLRRAEQLEEFALRMPTPLAGTARELDGRILDERLRACLSEDLYREFNGIKFRLVDSDTLDQNVVPNAELFAWCFAKLFQSGCPILEVIDRLGLLYRSDSNGRRAFAELKRGINSGEVLIHCFDKAIWEMEDPTETRTVSAELYAWEQLPELQPFIHQFRILQTDDAAKDLATIGFSFCPWAEEHEQACEEIDWDFKLNTYRRERRDGLHE